jgi:hypothetical protein
MKQKKKQKTPKTFVLSLDGTGKTANSKSLWNKHSKSQLERENRGKFSLSHWTHKFYFLLTTSSGTWNLSSYVHENKKKISDVHFCSTFLSI